MANDLIPFKRPGEDVTGHCTAAVTGKRVLRISGNRTSGPGLSSTAEGGNYQVAHCNGATQVPFGVSKYDAPLGGKVGVVREGIVPITAGATITAGELVMADANGQVIPYVGPVATGGAAVPDVPIPVGLALTAASAGQDAEVALMLS
jgi:hypothetical protein